MQERQTKQKRIIYDALKSLDHPTATEVYGYVHERYPKVSRATVFRVLNGFTCRGQAAELRHYHVHCRKCGRVADILMPADFPVKESVQDCCGFRLEDFSIEFLGTCPDCLEQEKAAEKLS